MVDQYRKKRSGHRRGLFAEHVAALWLQLKAYRILARRCKTPVGEIDLIAKRGHVLVFVEVKARSSRVDAASAIHSANRQRIVQAAHYYLHAHPQLQHCTMRFDAVLIAPHRLPHHIRHAFDAS